MATRRNSSATLRDFVDMADEYAPRAETEISILVLPDDVLRQIILFLTPRERLPLGDSCRRLRTLIFEDPELLRHLDFSKNAHLTTMTDIQRYFNNEDACQHVRRVNARNVKCIKAGDPLNNSIGRAINLVEVNIDGTEFENISQLGSFLKPLRHLQKLSIDWPETMGDDIQLSRGILEQSMSKLTYLSVRCSRHSSPLLFTNVIKLTNIKILRYRGPDEMLQNIMAKLPDPERWTDFQLCNFGKGAWLDEFYFEKDLEVCEELLQSARSQEFLNTASWENVKLKWALQNPECLLNEVLRITHADVPEDICCLPRLARGQPHFLKFEEAKLLLKDPRYQISYLYLSHELERDCDVHLLASAYPNLTELVLHRAISKLEKSPKESHSQRRLRKRGSSTPEEQDDSLNVDSSFKMLVQNTPQLRHFTLNPEGLYSENWDLDALCLISGWQNLETLNMSKIPFEDGQFLIEIGKKCKNLKKLSLSNCPCNRSTYRRSDESAIDKDPSFEMLKYCRNLRDLTIHSSDVDQIEMFATLVKNVKLESVVVYTSIIKYSAVPWILSLENLIRQCTKLTTIGCWTSFKTEDDRNAAESAVKRIRAECRRPGFQIDVDCRLTR